MPKADPDYAGLTMAARAIAAQESVDLITAVADHKHGAGAAKTLDGLLEQAKHLSPTGRTYGQIIANENGVHLMVWDGEPDQVEGPEGWGVETFTNRYLITCGTGRGLDDAVRAANAGMRSRS